MCMNDKFSLTSFSLTSFICWCERINKFSLTSFHCSQQYNYTADEKNKKTTRRRQFRFFIIANSYLTREKRMLACGLGCALLMQYEHSKRHMNRRWWVRPWATQRRSHKNKTTVRQQFPYFLWQVFLHDPYRRANSAMRQFFPGQVPLFKSYHASFWTTALVKEKIDKFIFTHQQIKFAKSKLVKENLLVCNRLKSKCPGAHFYLTVNFHQGHFIDLTTAPGSPRTWQRKKRTGEGWSALPKKCTLKSPPTDKRPMEEVSPFPPKVKLKRSLTSLGKTHLSPESQEG